VSSLSDALREEFREHGDDFGVTVVYPGAVRTRIATTERLRPENERSSSRGVEPYGPTHDSINLAYSEVLDPEQIGHLVVDAVRSNAPTSLTHPAPADFLQARLASIESGYVGPTAARPQATRSKEPI
jgi:short-subunit dehydrogenase